MTARLSLLTLGQNMNPMVKKTASVMGMILGLFASAYPARAEGTVIFEKDIEFSSPDNQHLQLDLARPKGAGPYPAIICIHGGGFYKGTRDTYDALIQKLAEHGY